MLRRFLILMCLPISTSGLAEEEDIYLLTNQFERDVRDQKYSQTTGGPLLKSFLAKVREDYKKRGCTPSQGKRWAFPVAWHGNRDIGGENGNGYRPAGFHYFDGIKTQGHSAHDIFIHDRNVDLRDDRYQKMVPALAVEPGVILSTEDIWDPNSKLKAGLYINVYHPQNNHISYYSHLKKVLVKPGDCVNTGDPLGWIGRTGLNADSNRSPTHLHFGRLFFDGTTYTPSNPYQMLLRSKKSSF